jgi:PAS domain S-box-containing protein
VYVTAYADEDVLAKAKITEPFGYIVKPFEDIELNSAVEIALYKHKMETKLKESEAWLHTTLRSIGDAVIATDTKGYVTFMNPVAQSLTGWNPKEAVGKPLTDVFNIISEQTRKDAENPAAKVIRKGSVVGLENHSILIAKDGKEIPIDDNGAPIRDERGNITGAVLVFRDITERKQAEKEKTKLENQLQQAHKMEAIGVLAGGIAHDFNNILSIILGNAELAMDDLPEWNLARHNLEEIATASLRARDVVQRLLSFSRQSDQEQMPVNISQIIKDCLKFLRSSIPTSIDIHRTISDVPGIVLADPTQIYQVMMNLCTNAAHAMSENGGIMEVSISVLEVGKNEAIQDIELSQGQYVKISVSDTGHGIAKENIDRIFEPYFTTKKVGEGSGIGLSVVYGIVKSYDGAISVDSEYGKGTTFNVFLPLVEKEPAFEEETDITTPTGCERILFVDDEKSIADMTSQMLKRLGYTVTVKTSSMDTLETFRAQPDNFDLIISDMSMPGITGDKLAKELQKIRPDIRIILCTGHSERINDEKAKSIGVRALVMKPIVKNELAKTIRKVLDGNE